MAAFLSRFHGTMKTLLAAVARLVHLVQELEARTALRPVVVPVRK
jgi:hypothetical protein